MTTQWEKPQLVVLVKGMPEERVLAACKNAGIGDSPDNKFDNCVNVVETECTRCFDLVVS